MIATDDHRPGPVCLDGASAGIWTPLPARIVDVRQETFNTKTYRLRFVDDEARTKFRFQPGQFNMLYAPGVGEAAISISSDPDRTDELDHTIRVAGSVTRAIERLEIGAIVGVRGPFGAGWPVGDMEGRDVVIIAGGIGLAPLRPVIYSLLRHPERHGKAIVLYGCREPDDRLYADELEQWERSRDRSAIRALVTVDNPSEDWVGPVGVVTNLMQRVRVDRRNTVVLVCGPRILNRVAARQFLELHVPPQRVYVSLERNMNCGFGRCGHCQYGAHFVCRDGPVFSFDRIADIFGKEEI